MIDHWLQKFKSGWIEKDVDKVMDLFSNDVEYWENPYKQLAGKDAIRAECVKLPFFATLVLNF